MTAVLFAVSAVCAHRSATLIGGTEANFWRLTVAIVFLGIWAFAFGIGMRGPALWMFVWSGLVGIGIGDVAYFQALPRLGSRLTVLIVQCLAAPFGALTEWLWMGTKLTGAQILSGLVILAGVAIALAPTDKVRRAPRVWTVGILFACVAAMGQGGGAVLSRRAYGIVHQRLETIDPGNAGFQRVVGGWILAGFCLLLVKRYHGGAQSEAGIAPTLAALPAAERWRRVMPWVLLNGLAGQTIGVSAMQRAIETTPTGIVLAIVATTPIVVIPLSLLTEREKPSNRSLAGAVVAVGGVIGLTCVGR